METTYLQEYTCIADHGSFTTAAAELHVTQSTLSKHVAVLERELGVELFVRDRNGIKMTQAGRVLYEQALRIDQLLKQTQKLVQSAPGDARLGVCDGDSGDDRSFVRQGNIDLRCKCLCAARRFGLTGTEAGALVLFLEERGFRAIRAELHVTRDEVADVLASAYKKLGVESKQEALDLMHSISE